LSSFAIDSSVLVAIIKDEPDADQLRQVVRRRNWAIGWPNVFETRIWLHRNRPPDGLALLDILIEGPGIQTIPFDSTLEALASKAFLEFGKGRHPAALNYGDCMAYSVATHLDLPLLFKGSDFGKTDIKIHPASVVVA
jgi:ribonuclease VapC